MTTPSQAAFEIAMASNMEKYEREICQIAWREGIAYGRKQALEESIATITELEVQLADTKQVRPELIAQPNLATHENAMEAIYTYRTKPGFKMDGAV